MSAATGVRRLHYPDLLLVDPDGRRLAVELELTSKGRERRERILSGYAADRRFDGVMYVVESPRLAESIQHVRPAAGHLPSRPRAAGAVGARCAARSRFEREPAGSGRAGCRAPPDAACASGGCRRSGAVTPLSGPQAPRPRRRPYWMLLVFAALALAPAGLGDRRDGRARAGRGHYRRRPSGRRRPGVHAAARDAGADGVTLGVDGDGRPVVLSDRQLSAHALIVGASGAGKSTTLLTILTDHIRRGRPVVAIDMKGSPAFAARACACGRRRGPTVPVVDAGRAEPLEPARPRQRDRAQGQADRHRAVHRAALSAGGRALRPDGFAGARAAASGAAASA